MRRPHEARERAMAFAGHLERVAVASNAAADQMARAAVAARNLGAAIDEVRRDSDPDAQQYRLEQHCDGRVVHDGPMTLALARDITWKRDRYGVPGVCKLIKIGGPADGPGEVIDVELTPPKLASGEGPLGGG